MANDIATSGVHTLDDFDGVQCIEFRAMGSQILAAVQSGDPEVASMLAQVPLWFEEWEQIFSRFREDSELTLLNRSGPRDEPVPVSALFWEVLQLALVGAASTGGLVTPTVLNALEAAGYTSSFDGIRDQPGAQADDSSGRAPDSAAHRLPLPDWREIRTYPATRSVTLPQGVRLDLGGFAKGWAADQAAARLAKYWPCLVNAGGDIAMSRPTAAGDDWVVSVDAPALPSLDACPQIDLLSLGCGGIATSGQDYRRWQKDGEWRHHIIDPRTGEPAGSDVLSATVIAGTAHDAEVAAKAALLLGSAGGLAWIEERPPLAGLLITENGQVLRSRRLQDYLWSSKYGHEIG